jgi:2-hydroxy-3-keto-5-methylthiopentenyl-1-phosphate phosphatase
MKAIDTLTTPEVRAMVKPWLTGDVDWDAAMLKRMFRSVGFSLTEWRQVVEEAR